jgi:DUF1365 family protein
MAAAATRRPGAGGVTGGSAIYSGVVAHRRLRPRAHALRYRVFMLLLDLDELPAVFGRLRLLAEGAFGLMSFRSADHGDQSGGDLRAYVRCRLTAAGVTADGPIRLLCMPRILGYGFNPISLYFCHDADGSLAAILYEVRNTFGQRHSYLVATPEGGDDLVRQSAPKRFHVSPFMDMDMTYDFTVRAPGELAGVSIDVRDAQGLMLSAAFHGRRAELTDAGLLRAWVSHPLLTLKVVAGIHWEAAKIFVKGVKLRPQPPVPAAPVTLGSARSVR